MSVSESDDGSYNIGVRVVLKFGVDRLRLSSWSRNNRSDIVNDRNHASVIDVVIDDIKQDLGFDDEDEAHGLLLIQM